MSYIDYSQTPKQRTRQEWFRNNGWIISTIIATIALIVSILKHFM